MQKRALILLVGSVAAFSAAPQSATDDFEAFRRNMLQSQSSFRNELMDNYADFLNSAWEEFERFKAEPRDPKPKPTAPPALAPLPPPKTPAPPKIPTPATRPALPPSPSALTLPGRLSSGEEFADQWRALSASPAAKELVRTLGNEAEALGLNDFLTFDHVCRNIDARFPQAHSTSRASLTHFIMTSLGYDIRIALSNGDGVLLVPTVQTVYGKPYMMMDGRKFYIFSDNVSASGRISTCRIPANTSTGRAIDLHINRPLNLPYEPYSFNLESDGITLRGEVNKNIFGLLYRYPQTEMEVYATSVIDPELRSNLVDQLKTQLGNLPRLEAINTLLHFTQNAIDYATDDAFHGFEKPYFLEEWLFYPRNDCEDRAVFYTYMLSNVLGVECQLLTYPGHESAAVRLDESIDGDSYTHNGRTFYISDPTYIGASTGQCMPDFVGVTPEIEYHYKK